ncbi:hypothetical protein LK07_21155 [Streptomyces pluripotens]|uniref:L,D-transpeptidase n=1 Tax=Streptomyces pluripotens TaxID=1355015 RepID=A0A221P1F3_9ACTN|nr:MULTISPECIES: hypothetical protein [Streptomyces]ARP71855.1 hypothetical protein LK06_020000 [Streptomyces pluripotens]ASN26103.1 hypothetical protein LK07_21155 [Streptomyces pluripotens]KIE26269.1 hypothetical protein LK08_13705 [Streptomyces sp. MUSC 125]MCH0556333.1 hypothetical protein [Streptomyces sp. MUM 16J]
MAGTSSGIVAGLTATAVGAVGFLTYQAQATVPAGLGGKPAASASPSGVAAKAPRDRRHPTALPGHSGRGERVVYSLDDDRVWLVNRRNRVERTFKVAPGNVDPPPGAYRVTSRSHAVTGTDGIPVEHVVRFTGVNGVTIGFSAAVSDGPRAPADPSLRRGGIRETRADGDATWKFATIGVRVVVIR